MEEGVVSNKVVSGEVPLRSGIWAKIMELNPLASWIAWG